MSRSHSHSSNRSGSYTSSGTSSGTSSRSSSNSMKLPEPVAAPHPEGVSHDPAVAAPVAAAGADAAPQEDQPAVFLNLGENGRSITGEELRAFLESKATDPSHIVSVRLRGRHAFVDTTSVEEARHLVATLDKQELKEGFPLVAEMGRHTNAQMEARRQQRTEERLAKTAAPHVTDSRQVFINLGPRGREIHTDDLRTRVEAVCPVVRFERLDKIAFVDVPTSEDAQKVIDQLHNIIINDIRLIVEHSHGRRKRERDDRRDRDGRRGGDRRRDEGRRDDGRRRSRRDDSREVSRHRRHRHRRSYTPSSRSTSSSYSRGRRSYSSDSRDSRDHHRGSRHRRHRGGERRRRGGRGGRGGRRLEGREERRGGDGRRDERRGGEGRRGGEERREGRYSVPK